MLSSQKEAPTANNSSQVQALAGLLKVHKVNFLTQKFVFLKKLTTFVVFKPCEDFLLSLFKLRYKLISVRVSHNSNVMQISYITRFEQHLLTLFLF